RPGFRRVFLLVHSPTVLVLAQALLADAVVVEHAERPEELRLGAVVFLEAADALARRPLRQQLIVLPARGHAALVSFHGHFPSVTHTPSKFSRCAPPTIGPFTRLRYASVEMRSHSHSAGTSSARMSCTWW